MIAVDSIWTERSGHYNVVVVSVDPQTEIEYLELDEGITCRVPIDTFLEMFTQTEDLEK